MTDSQSRRDFLSPRSFAKLFSTVSGMEWISAEPGDVSQGWLCRMGREAMATRFEVLFDMLDTELSEAAQEALDLITALESQLTVYREDSEVSRMNREASSRCVPVEKRLFELLYQCRGLWKETEGAFDITTHSLLQAWGLFRGPRGEPDSATLQEAVEKSGFDHIVFDRKKKTIRYRTEGVGINLGAVGKGYALDRAAETLHGGGLQHFLIHGGNSSMLGQGTSSWDQGWLVDIAHPLDWSIPVAKVRLLNAALSTSALEPEAFRGETPPHILDPRTGRPPVTDLVSVSVLAGTATRAEGLSTALLVMGLDKARQYCEKHPEVGAVFIRCGEESDDLDLIVTGLCERCVEVLN